MEEEEQNNNENIHTGGSEGNYNISAGDLQLTDPENEKSNHHSRNNSNDRYANKEEKDNNDQQEEEDNYDNQAQLNNISEGMEPISEAEIEEEKKPKNQKGSIEQDISNDYEKMFDEIMKKNKNNLIFKKENKLNSLQSNSYNKSIEVSGSNRTKTPVELTLYADATKRKEKMQKLEYNHMMNIILDSTKTKISNNSHKIAINKVEKMIDDAIELYQKDNTVSFINVGEILTELKIFRETFPKRQKENKKSVQNYKDIQMEIINVKETDKRKQKEVNFYEQLWLTINPGNKPTIKSDILSEILKILFAPINSNVKEISEILKQFLLTAFFLNSNPEEVKRYISPITEKDINEDDIWPIEKLVKEFLLLKQNLLAYQGIKHFNKTIQSEITKTQKEMSFAPKINESTQGWNYYSERLPALVEREKLRLQVLDEMKKENEENDLKECSFKPKINKPNKFLIQRNSSVPIYDKLYSTNKEKYDKYEKMKEEEKRKKEEEELQGCTFKPNLISQKTFKKCMTSTEKPRGFDEFSQKMREGIIKAAEKKYRENKIPTGENYEKIKKANIQPFDITDLRKKDQSKSKNSSSGTRSRNEDFFTIQIKIPNGKERTIKVYLLDDPFDVADNFCKTYCLKEEIKERLAKTILNFRNLYLQKNNIKDSSQVHS